MTKVRVLHVITHLGFGGALDNTLLTVQGHARDRYVVHLAAGPAPGEGYADWEARARACSDAMFILPNLCRPVHLPRDIRALNELTKLIRDGHYQVVHTHCAKAGLLGRIAARRARVPVVVHTYHLFPWQTTKDPSGSPGRKLLSAAKRWLYILLERYAASLSDALITVSDLNRREAIALKVAPAGKLTTIYSGIDVDRFAVRSGRTEICRGVGLDPGRPIVGSIGRLSTQKAPLDFVSAAKIVLQRKPHVQFLLVGDGPMVQQVQKAIDGEPRIKMLGCQSNVPEILSILDTFVLSSLWEGLGRALTEAMIAGVPVVVTAVDGVPELVTHGETGLLSPPSNPARLADNIVRLLDNPEAARTMAERAKQGVVTAFGGRRMVERIEMLFSGLLARKGVLAAASRSSPKPSPRTRAAQQSNAGFRQVQLSRTSERFVRREVEERRSRADGVEASQVGASLRKSELNR